MQLTKFSLIALNVMILASRDHREVLSNSDLSEKLGESYNHMVKVVGTLVKSGFLLSSRGRNGGVSLMHDPEEITLGQLVKETEIVTTIIDCDSASCPLVTDCNLRSVLNEANIAFYDSLDRVKLSSVV